MIFTREIARLAGAVILERYVYARTDPCRLSRSLGSERSTGGALTTSSRWTLARPADAVPLEGTERVVVWHASGGSTLVRVLAEAGVRTFQTVRKSDVTMDGVEPVFDVATTRARGPVPLAWSTSITLDAGE